MRKIIIILLLITVCWEAKSQQVALSSQYMMNRLVINPAYTGELGFYSASISYRKQWINIEGAPSTQNISLHGPALKGKLGLGLLIFRDVIGVSNENNITGSFAYKIKYDKKRVLSFGLSASAVLSNNKWSQINTTEANDNAFSADSPQYFYPDFSAGAYYSTQNYFVGLSIPMFLQHELNANSSSFKIKNDFSNYNYLLEAGIIIKPSDKLTLKPSVLARFLPNAAFQMDINTIADFNNLIGIGFSYRTQDAIVGLIQFHITDQIIFGYSFDQTISKLQKYNNGSHEAFLRYDFRYKVKAFDPRFF